MYPINFSTMTPVVFEVPWGHIMRGTDARRVARSVDDKDQLEVLELVFRNCNHVDDNEWIAGKKLRSMSVGDIVFIDTLSDEHEPENREVWVCCGVGWKKVEELEIVP